MRKEIRELQDEIYEKVSDTKFIFEYSEFGETESASLHVLHSDFNLKLDFWDDQNYTVNLSENKDFKAFFLRQLNSSIKSLTLLKQKLKNGN